EGFFGEEIFSKKAQQEMKLAQLQDYFDKMKTEFPAIAFWLDILHEKKSEGRWIVQMAEKQADELVELFKLLERAFRSLPMEAERLSMFSQRITGDPHAFDLQTDLGRMLLHLLSVQRALELDAALVIPVSTEEINEMLEHFHIYR